MTVDTLRADALGSYGRVGSETPRMDGLAAAGVRFEFAHAHNVVTLPSHANILSGRYPFDHGVRDNSGFRFPRRIETLASLLRRHGYRTGAFVSAFPLDSRFGLDAGFDVYDDRLGDPSQQSDFQMQERPGAATVTAARVWIEATPGPRFCWIHLFEPHAPYRPPFEWRSRVPSAYDGEVAAVDIALGPLIDPLLAQGEDGDTLVVLTADHGEGLGEHGEMTHGVFTYESTLRVPLVLYSPRLFSPRVVGGSARHVDILPTILDALGLPLPDGLPGQSLLAAAQGRRGPPAPPSYFEALTPSLTRGWAPPVGVLRDRLKYIDLPIPELFDLATDQNEQANLAAHSRGPREEMQALLGRIRVANEDIRRISESAEVRQRLAGLGYLDAGGIKSHFGEQDDPKRNVAFEAGLESVIETYVQGDIVSALKRCEELVREHPRVPLGLRHLSFLRSRAGDVNGAVDAGRRALEVDPGSAEAAAELGRLLNDLGRPKEAESVLAPRMLAADVDLDILMTYGIALAQTGRKKEALAALQRARQADPSNALAAYSIGTAYLLFGDRESARQELEAAVALDPAMARAQGALGVIAATDGRRDEAVRRWTRALEVDPRDPDTLLNLGTLLWREGRRDEARAYFSRFLAEAPEEQYAGDRARVLAQLDARGRISR